MATFKINDAQKRAARRKTALLGGASILILAAYGPSELRAAEIVLPATFAPETVGFKAIDQLAENNATISATANGNTADFQDLAAGSGADPSAVSVTGNLVGAYATGNNFEAGVEVDLINDATTPNNPNESGIGILTFAQNTGEVSATALSNSLSISETDFTSGSLENNGNVITAETTLNNGVTDSIGYVPNGYDSATQGSIEFGSGTDPIVDSEATIATGSVQENSGDAATSDAFARFNTIDLVVTPFSTNQQVDGSFDLSRNEISTNFTGNSARSSVEIETGGSPDFEGSVAVSNVQANQNLGDDGVVATSRTVDSIISATIGDIGPNGSSTLESSLDVSDNTVASYVSGNQALANGGGEQAGNQIIIDDTMSVVAQSAGNSASAATDNSTASGSLDAGLALYNFQANVQDDDGLSSLVTRTDVEAVIQNMDEANVGVSGNTVLSQGRSNAVSNLILAPGVDGNTASFAGSVALLNAQTNYLSDLSARVNSTDIQVQAGNASVTGDDSVIVESTIALEDNRVAANAIANQAGNSVGLGGTDVDLGGSAYALSGGVRVDGQVSSTAGATLTNFQSDYFNTVEASNIGTAVTLDASDITSAVQGSTLQIVGSETQVDVDAVAASASGNNILAVDGGNITGSVGLNNLQVQQGVDDFVAATVTNPLVRILVDDDSGDNAGDVGVLDSTIELTGMTTRALGYGATATNRVEVDASAGTSFASAPTGDASTVAVDLGEGDGNFFDGNVSNLPTANANYALLSGQNREGDVSATVSADEAAYQIQIGDFDANTQVGDALRSTVTNDGNTLLASAFGNQLTNDMELVLGDVDDAQTGADNVANITNVQTLGADTTVTASVDTSGAGVSTAIAYTAKDSMVSVSGNTTQAQAFGNRASSGGSDAFGNRLTVDATTLDLTGPNRDGLTQTMAGAGQGGAGSILADAAFSVQNVQSGADTVSATLGANTNAGTSLTVGGDVLTSTLAQDDNLFLADAFNNQAVNDLELTAQTVATTSGVQNFQVTSSTTESSTGQPGEVGTGQPGEVGEDLEPRGLYGDYLKGNPDIPGEISGEPASKAIQTSIGGNSGSITSSTVSVDRNLDFATTVANDAVNRLSVNAGDLDTATVNPTNLLPIAVLRVNDDLEADADHAINNYQLLQNTGSTSAEAAVTLGITVDPNELASGGAVTSDSSLSVSGNEQQALAMGNRATSSLSATATNLGDIDGDPGASTALASLQTVEANETLASTSWMDVSAPASMQSSSLELSKNVTNAIATFNQAINTTSVTGTNVATTTAGPNQGNAEFLGGASVPRSRADHALMNSQSVGANSSVTAEASLNLYNQELGASTVTGIQNSSIMMSDNSANAQATSNVAENTMNLTALSNISATGAVTNSQDNGASVTATTFGAVNLGLEGNGVGVDTMASSSAALDSNSFSAGARGNNALNALNIDVGSNYSGGVSGASTQATPDSGTASAVASYAVLNRQSNTADISATVQGSVQASFGLGSAATLDSSTMSASGNTYMASAFGNVAQNTMTASARPGGTMPMAMTNSQNNSGDVTATANGVSIGVGVSANGNPVSGSSVGISGNTIRASSVGNSVTTRMSSGY